MTDRYATSREIENIITQWLDAAPENGERFKTGISMLPAQTGSGKSYAVAKIMAAKSCDESFGHRMIYMVHTKENLKHQYNDFRKFAAERNGGYANALLLKEDADMVIDFFADSDIPDFREYREYRSLMGIARRAAEYHNSETGGLDRLELFRDKINNEAGRLRKRLRREYKKLPKEKKAGFRSKVSMLFPTASLHRYKAVFMTTSKFILPVWTLTGSTYIYEMEDFEGAKLFIDEFDAQKSVLLSGFIANATASAVDKISFFVNARHVLKESEFLSKYGIDEQTAVSVSEHFDGIYEKYIDTFSFVYRSEKNPSRYILRSEAVSSFESADTPLTINRDESKTINWVEEDSEKRDYRFVRMLKEIDIAVKRLAGLGFRAVAVAKEEAYRKRQEGELSEWVDYVHLSDTTVRQFIGEFNLSPGDENFKYFENLILHRNKAGQENPLCSFREDFYDNGLSLIHMEDIGEKAKRTSFSFFSLLHTPEYFIAKKIASRMHIIAISATVNINSVIRNFDLGYLRATTSTETLSTEEIERLDRLYVEGKQQADRPFHIEFVDSGDTDPDKVCSKYFNGDRSAGIYLSRLFSRKTPYTVRKYVKLIHLYWCFVTVNDIKSFLVLLNGYPKTYPDGDADDSILKGELHELFSLLISGNRGTGKLKRKLEAFAESRENQGKQFAEDDLFFVYTSKPESHADYISKIRDNRLRNGGSAFVISSYQAMGAGRNIHYSVEENGTAREKDYDAIYCEKPTHLLVRAADEENPVGSLLKLLYQLHSLYVSENISKKEFHSYLSFALTRNEISWKSISYNKGEDYNNTVMMTVIQAIGRLHRANNPHDPMYIFLDETLYSAFNAFDTRGHTLLPSVRKILDLAKNRTKEDTGTEASEFTAETARKSIRMNRKIAKMTKSFSSAKTVELWKQYEAQLLANPTVPHLEHRYGALYTPRLPNGKKRYWYREHDDYSEIEVRLAGGSGFVEVSPEGAHLPILEKVPGLEPWFREKHIDTEWKHPHLMTPVVFNNLYKGRLGESLGKWIFETMCGIRLGELPAEDGYYEFFDYISDRGIYVDFKYYSRHRIASTEEWEVRERAAQKLQTMGGGFAVIANLLYQGGYERVSREITVENNVAVIPFVIDASDTENPALDRAMISKIKELFL